MEELLPVFRRTSSSGSGVYFWHRKDMSLDVATEVLSKGRYPGFLVDMAEAVFASRYRSAVGAVRDVAAQQAWCPSFMIVE